MPVPTSDWKSDLLPYTARRRYLRSRWPHTCARLENLRRGEDEAGFSLVGFDRLRCIFVHIPKCAGISIARSLFGNLGAGHVPLSLFQTVYTREEFSSYLKFAFVRNPWDRVVSAFHFLKEGGLNAHDAKWAARHGLDAMSFEAFVTGHLARREILDFYHFHPQSLYICDAWGRLLVDRLARFERIEEDFREICEQLGIQATLTHANRTVHRERDYRQHYTESSRRIVADVYRRDLYLLGYSF